MKAFVMKSLNQVGFVEKPVAKPGICDAIIKTTRALICTSDSHTVHGAIGSRENLTLGHEAVGVVHESNQKSGCSSRETVSSWAPSRPIGVISLPRRAIPHNPGDR